MITVEALQTAINQTAIAHASAFGKPVITVPLASALGCVLADNIVAGFDIPRQNLSAMDGFALAIGSELDESSVVQIVGESSAGKPFVGELVAGQGVRIFTGAVVPDGCHTVVMQEHTNWEDVKHDTIKSSDYTILLSQAIKRFANIRKQGEEVSRGECVLEAGKHLNPTDISLLANLGVANVAVYEPLVVGIIATGDELVEVGNPLPSLANIYNSNTPTLKALLTNLPIVIKDYGIIPDDETATHQAIMQAVSECDVLISSAGVSVGDYDYLTTAIHQLGKITHYKVAMKPGKPFVFGELYHEANDSDKTVPYFGLPGNPLSTVIGCLQFIMPALWRLSKVSEDDLPERLVLNAKASTDLPKKQGRKEYARGIYHQDDKGDFHVLPLSVQDSHRVKQLSLANCLLVLDKDSEGVKQGDMVRIEPFSWTHL